MNDLFTLLALTASLFSIASPDAQTFNNPYRIPTTQNPVSVFLGQSPGGYIAGPILGAMLATRVVESGVVSATQVADTVALNEQGLSSSLEIPSSNEWTWMGGSNSVGVGCTLASNCGKPGVYGTPGTPATGNIPGGRVSSANWTDQNGHEWLFGGWGYDANGDGGELNDLWEFNPSTDEWAWMGGSSTTGIDCSSFNSCGWPGVYGTLRSPAAGNIPGSRYASTTWIDKNGNLWLFGGYGFDANGFGYSLNDLWEFNPSTKQWAWMSGDNTGGWQGVYGTPHSPAAGNTPGARIYASGWIDTTGNLWLFGGSGYDANGHFAYLNDLWEFNPSTKQWAWMGGNSTVPVNCSPLGCSMPGVTGTLLQPGTGNIPEGREYSAAWTDSSGDFWLFGGDCFIEGNPDQLIPLNDLWEFIPSSNEWAWMGGADTAGCIGNQPGVYGTLGVPAVGNIPAGLRAAATWTDGSGDFWLFGGWSVVADGTGLTNYLNNLWEFNPSMNEWTWMGGSDTTNLLPGVYGSLGTPAAANTPGGRQYAVGWADNSGNFWIFGGLGWDVNSVLGYENDVWRYGSAPSLPAAATPTFNVPAGSYSTAQTVTISDTTPGAVIYYTTNGLTPTTSSSVFGIPILVSSSETIEAIATASGYSTSAVASATYTIAVPTTTTLSASAATLTVGQSLTLTATVTPAGGATPTGTVTFYNGTASLGTANLNSSGVATLALTPAAGSYSINASYGGSATDLPSISAAVSVTVNGSGGGVGSGEWTWMGGNSTQDSNQQTPGIYGTLGTPAAGNIPGWRQSSVSWRDESGNLWLFGGYGNDRNGTTGYLNDLWVFNPVSNLWAWMGGSDTVSAIGDYGVLGTPAAGNVPGSRVDAVRWTDSSGHFWLYGGMGLDSTRALVELNDLWEYNPATNLWAWMGGSSTEPVNGQGAPPVYGALGVAAKGNNPGARMFSTTWNESQGNLWLYGGQGYFPGGVYGTFNDLWEFNPSTSEWAWMGGNDTPGSHCSGGNCQYPGVYGTLGTSAATNNPGSRNFGASWTDNNGRLWLFGGSIPGTEIAYLNDVWEYSPSTNQWAWMGGVSAVDQSGEYGTLGTAAAGNIPGSRCCTAVWTDSNGSFWLFGGQGYDGNGNQSVLNDLWKFSPLTNEWAWIDGNNLGDQRGIYGILGTPDAANIPGSRDIAVSWADNSGNFWLFGGDGVDGNGNGGGLNDLWRYGTGANTEPVTTTPVFSLPTGAYTGAQSVQITDATPGATIYYTADGTTPTTGSSVYSSTITVATSETLKAIAKASGDLPSAVASATYTISEIPTSTVLVASSGNLTAGETLTLTATVTRQSGATPAGTVTFYNGPASLGSALLNGSGVATLTLTPTVGSYSITASYGGSPTDLASVSSPPVVVTVTPASTATVLTASPNPAPFGAGVTFSATVSSATGAPLGAASFYDGTVSLGTATLASGVATYSTSALSVGSHNITAQYAGTASFTASTSNLVVEVISPADFSISAAPASQSVYTGEAATYIATINPGAGFNLPVALSCSELPANTTCRFSPAIIPAGGKNSTLVIQTTAPHNAAKASMLSSGIRVTALAGLLLLLIPRRLRLCRGAWPVSFLLLAFFIAGAANTGCGAPGPLSGGTPVGTQSITVTGIATNGSQALTHTATVTLNVKSLF